MLNIVRFGIDKVTKKVTLHGIKQPKASLISCSGEHLVIQVPGHQYTYDHQIKKGTYYPMEYQIIKIRSLTDEGYDIEGEGERITNFKPKDRVDDSQLKGLLEDPFRSWRWFTEKPN